MHPTVAAAMRFIAFSELANLFRGNMVAHRPVDFATALLLLIVAAAPTPMRCTLVIFARTMYTLVRLPFVWDAEILALFVWAAMLPALGSHGAYSPFSKLPLRCAAEARAALAVLYLSAGLWKLNTSFINPQYSCGSIYAVTLLDAYAPLVGVAPTAGETSSAAPLLLLFCSSSPLLLLCCPSTTLFAFLRSSALSSLLSSLFIKTTALARTVAAAAPLLIAVGEMATGLAFALPVPKAGCVAVTLGLLLHLGICLTPPPNNIGAFSVTAARY